MIYHQLYKKPGRYAPLLVEESTRREDIYEALQKYITPEYYLIGFGRWSNGKDVIAIEVTCDEIDIFNEIEEILLS